ncbi:glutamate receptor 1-like [Panulirus ornatus]|uniref:glutamate receptor 1-like n=1 Tax=Panulirus ornatus TaxID=150431 RepID=UPI003A8458AD
MMEGGRGVTFSTGLLYGWGAILEQPFIDPSISVSGQVLVGWWLVYCEVIGTGYRSSLISHLTVQGKSRPLETFEDLVSQDGWNWGFEPWLLTGAIVDYFATHTDPVILQVFEEREEMAVKEALKRVLAGSFTLISFKNYVTSVIYTRFADHSGRTPFHIGSNEIPVLVYFGWGIRKGAPFYQPFKKMMSRLHDAGIVPYWGDDVLARHIRENREDPELEDLISHMEASKKESSQVVLELQHLQGAFYLLLFGSGVACLFLLGEILYSYCNKTEG